MFSLLEKIPFLKKNPLHTGLVVGYIYTTFLLIFFDALWLGLIAKKFYALHIGYLMLSEPNWFAACLFYLIYPIGIMIFVLQPSQGILKKAATLGALFGFFTYATYELTNWAVIFEWPALIVFVDMLWGACLTALVSTLTVLMYQKTSQ